MNKPICSVLDQDGNIFNIMGLAAAVLRKAGLREQIGKMYDEVQQTKSYNEALVVIGKYVELC